MHSLMGGAFKYPNWQIHDIQIDGGTARRRDPKPPPIDADGAGLGLLDAWTHGALIDDRIDTPAFTAKMREIAELKKGCPARV